MQFHIQRNLGSRIRSLTATFSILFLIWTNSALAQVDLEVEARLSIRDATYVDSSFFWLFSMKQSGTSGSAVFPTGSVVLRIDLPPGIVADDVRRSSAALLQGRVECAQTGARIECISFENFTLLGETSYQDIFVSFSPDQATVFSIPAEDGVCRVDPDNVVDEGGGDGALSNDCFGELGPVVIKDLPPELQQQWLTVTNLDNIVHEYDHSAFEVKKAVAANPASGPGTHLVSEVEAHPQSGDLYVFYSVFQTDQHRLGILSPSGEISDVGATGSVFHDAAFTPDGMLYGVGVDGVLYSVNTNTGVSTGLCSLPVTTRETGLAWHPLAGLVQVTSETLDKIVTAGLPAGSPQDACAIDSVPLSPPLYNVYSAEAVGEYIYVNAQGRLILLDLDGARADLGPMATRADGLVPGRTLSVLPAPACPAPFYITATRSTGSAELLFALNPESGDMTYVQQIGQFRISTLDWDKTERRLRAGGRSVLTGERALLSIDPCSAEVLSIPSDASQYDGLDITPQGSAWLVGNGLAELDLDSGLITPVVAEGDPIFATSLAIRGDQVLIDDYEWPETASLIFHSLANWPANPVSMPLHYGEGLEFGSSRVIYDLDVSPGDGQIYSILQRADNSWNIPDAAARPNALVEISNGGLVTRLMDLPVSAMNLAGTDNRMSADGFESSLNGCYNPFNEGQWFEWPWGENQVSTITASAVDNLPVFIFNDAQCTLLNGKTIIVFAHALSQEEADTLCQSEDYSFGSVLSSIQPQPAVGQFYTCKNN